MHWGDDPGGIRARGSASAEPWARRPAGVTIAVLVLGLVALAAGVSILSPPGQDLFARREDWGSFCMGLQFIWTVGVCLALVRPLWIGRRWAWSAACSYLFLHTAAAVAALAGVTAFELGHLGRYNVSRLLGPGLLAGWTLILALLLGSLFRRRRWFGVGAREGWRTLLREGGPVLVVTAVLDVAWLVAVAGVLARHR